MGSWFWGTDALITNEKVIGRKVTGDRFKRQCPGKCFQLDADHGADHTVQATAFPATETTTLRLSRNYTQFRGPWPGAQSAKRFTLTCR